MHPSLEEQEVELYLVDYSLTQVPIKTSLASRYKIILKIQS